MPLDLEQKVVLAEDVAIRCDRLPRAVDVAVDDLAGRLALETTRKGDQALRVLGQDLLVDARLVVHPLHLADGAKPHQVEVALVAGREERQVVGVAVHAAFPQQARPRRDVDLAADDRLDPGFLAGLIEVDRAVHDAVVCKPDRRHPELGRTRHHGGNAAGAVEQRILGVVVEVDESFWGVPHRLILGVAAPGG